MNNYYEKYLKYKNKYLKLKNLYNKKGGNNELDYDMNNEIDDNDIDNDIDIDIDIDIDNDIYNDIDKKIDDTQLVEEGEIIDSPEDYSQQVVPENIFFEENDDNELNY